MSFEDQKKTKAGAGPLEAVVSRFFGVCWDCSKPLYPWQRRGIDGQSHRECHRDRCRRLMEEMPDMRYEILAEIEKIESIYGYRPGFTGWAHWRVMMGLCTEIRKIAKAMTTKRG